MITILYGEMIVFSLILSLAIAASEPSNFQMGRLICNDRVVAEFIVDIRTTKWQHINKTWVLIQYDKYKLEEYKPKNSERCYAVNSED